MDLPIHNGRSFLLAGADCHTKILEIGASYNPAAPKREGWNCFIADHASKEELIRKYSSENFDASFIEDVDFIWRGGNLLNSIEPAHHGTFDLIIASQVIEHIPNPIQFLLSLEQLLSVGGAISLSVPDKRRCFDFFRPLSTTGDWLRAFFESRSTHDVKTLYDQAAYIVGEGPNGGRISWASNDHLRELHFRPGGGAVPGFALYESMYDKEFSSRYIDCHAWVFVPSSFELIIHELYATRMVGLYPAETAGSDNYEFFVRLIATRDATPISESERMDFLRKCVKEQIEGFQMIETLECSRDINS